MKTGLTRCEDSRLKRTWTDGKREFSQRKRLRKSATELAKGIQEADFVRGLVGAVHFAKRQFPRWKLRKLMDLVYFARNPNDYHLRWVAKETLDEFKRLLGI